jgi:hypothetical protein
MTGTVLDRSRLEYFIRIAPNVSDELKGIEHGLVACLSSSEVVEGLYPPISDNARVRHILLNQIKKFERTEAILKLLEDLVRAHLNWEVNGSIDVARRNQVLGEVLEIVSKDTRQEVKWLWVYSGYANSKQHLCKHLEQSDPDDMHEHVGEVWRQTGRWSLAKHIIYEAPDHILLKYSVDLFHADSPAWMIARLVLRCRERQSEFLSVLRSRDRITYLYLAVKLRFDVSEEEVRSIVSSADFRDERIGLLFWCVGHLGFWEILVGIVEGDDRLGYP